MHIPCQARRGLCALTLTLSPLHTSFSPRGHPSLANLVLSSPAQLNGNRSRVKGRCLHTGILMFPLDHCVKGIHRHCRELRKTRKEKVPSCNPQNGLCFIPFLCISAFLLSLNLNSVHRDNQTVFVLLCPFLHVVKHEHFPCCTRVSPMLLKASPTFISGCKITLNLLCDVFVVFRCCLICKFHAVPCTQSLSCFGVIPSMRGP